MDSVQRLRAAGAEGREPEVERADQGFDAGARGGPGGGAATMVVQQAAPPPQVIVIEPAQPSVVYVPAYNPAVVYGPWPYPAYPPYYYPPPPGYWLSRTIATGIAWGVGIGVNNALWGGCHWGWGHSSVEHQRQSLQQHQRQPTIDVNSNRTSWNHNTEHRGKTAYRGGDATAAEARAASTQAGNREQYRGKDASRDASRERASQSMADRGISADNKSAARDKAQGMDKSAARDKAQGVDRSAAQQKAQSVDKRRRVTRRRARTCRRARQAQSADRARRRSADATQRAHRKPRQRAEGCEQHAGACAGGPRRSEPGSGAAFRRRCQPFVGGQRREPSERWRRRRRPAASGGASGPSGGGGGGGGGGRWRRTQGLRRSRRK